MQETTTFFSHGHGEGRAVTGRLLPSSTASSVQCGGPVCEGVARDSPPHTHTAHGSRVIRQDPRAAEKSGQSGLCWPRHPTATECRFQGSRDGSGAHSPLAAAGTGRGSGGLGPRNSYCLKLTTCGPVLRQQRTLTEPKALTLESGSPTVEHRGLTPPSPLRAGPEASSPETACKRKEATHRAG